MRFTLRTSTVKLSPLRLLYNIYNNEVLFMYVFLLILYGTLSIAKAGDR
jgi:hypothetical protein